MGREIVNHEVHVTARLSRHNAPEDERDNESWERLRAEIDAAVDQIVVKPEYSDIDASAI
jgi:hypothetical protein